MATIYRPRVRPPSGAPEASKVRSVGLVLAVIGLMLSVVTLVANVAVSGDAADRISVLPWSFGLTTAAFATIKVGIAVILWGIVMRIWSRADSMRDTLSRMTPPGEDGTGVREYDSAYGPATESDSPPHDLPIHRMAKRMFGQMLAMGTMAVIVGLVVSFTWASGGSTAAAAWTQGLQFLGEGLLLAGISFLLGTILWAIRTAGGEVQASLGVRVRTLVMPKTAKAFVALMVLGLLISMVQFVLYLVVAGGVDQTAAWFAVLGPLRELGLALILSGIAMALVTIGTALDFQFSRVVELVRSRP